MPESRADYYRQRRQAIREDGWESFYLEKVTPEEKAKLQKLFEKLKKARK